MQNATHCLISVLYLIVYYLTFLCAHYIICPALLFHASEVSKKLLSDYEVVILYHILRILPIMQLIMKMRIYIVTIVEPNGVEVNIDIIIPNTSPNTERIAEYIITDLHDYWKDNRTVFKLDSVSFLYIWGSMLTWTMITALCLIRKWINVLINEITYT